MTEHQILVAQALERCTFLPGSPEKRFARDMGSRSRLLNPPALTLRQTVYLDDLAWRFRRQMPAALVPGRP
jgi:hypothetical protein